MIHWSTAWYELRYRYIDLLRAGRYSAADKVLAQLAGAIGG